MPENTGPEEEQVQEQDDGEHNIEDSCVEDHNSNQSSEVTEKIASDWCDKAVKLLISLYKEKKPLVESRKIKTLKKMWEVIIIDMKKKGGYSFTTLQAENKWKTLERAYKNMLENKKKTGRGRKTCPYQNELAEILNLRASILPPAIIDGNVLIEQHLEEPTASGNNVENDDKLIDQQSSLNTPSAHMEPMQKNKPKRRRISNHILELKQAIVETTQVTKEIENKKIEQREMFLAEIKKRNELLEKYLSQRT